MKVQGLGIELGGSIQSLALSPLWSRVRSEGLGLDFGIQS